MSMIFFLEIFQDYSVEMKILNYPDQVRVEVSNEMASIWRWPILIKCEYQNFHTHTHIYIYIYIHTHRERERERERGGQWRGNGEVVVLLALGNENSWIILWRYELYNFK